MGHLPSGSGQEYFFGKAVYAAVISVDETGLEFGMVAKVIGAGLFLSEAALAEGVMHLLSSEAIVHDSYD